MAASDHLGQQFIRARVPLNKLITTREGMQEVMDSGRTSTTPGPVELVGRRRMPGRYEIEQGHHRIADAIRRGEDHVDAIIDHTPSDEPYERPFYNFNQHMNPQARTN